MQLPKLTPLQSRLLASVIATGLVVVIWLSFQPHHFVYAAELPLAPEQYSDLGQLVPPSPQQHDRLGDMSEDYGGSEEEEQGGYMPEFAYFDRSLIGRADSDVQGLTNNVAMGMDVSPGNTQNFVMEKSKQSKRGESDVHSARARSDGINASTETRVSPSDETEETDSEASGELKRDNLDSEEEGTLRPRQSKQVYISANTCSQPDPDVALITNDPPQLTLYVSTSSNNQKPGPSATNDLATDPISFDGGYANFSVPEGSDVYIGVSAPELTKGWNGSWSFEIAASTDGWYHTVTANDAFLYLVDTDSTSALFISKNLSETSDDTQQWLDLNNNMPFTMYAFSDESWGMDGIEKSFCGLKKQFQENGIKVDSSMTTWPNGTNPVGQFHVQALNSSTTYNGFLVQDGNGTTNALQVDGNALVRGGGQVWAQFNWTTKADASCQIIYNLTFCNQTAYAVPSNPNFSSAELAQKYDDQAAAYYQNFTNSLAQIACETTGTAQYSLARSCDDCAYDYKNWLCSVVMPRCEDFSATDSFLVPRRINTPYPNGTMPTSNTTAAFAETRLSRLAYNSSRVAWIDEVINPGPYKELLPCDDLCFDIVRSCPADLNFACPNSPQKEVSYGMRDRNPKNLTCNYPGAVVALNDVVGGAGALVSRLGLAVMVAVVVGSTLA